MTSSSKKYYSVEPATFKLDGGAMFGIIPKPLWEKKISADESNRIDLALRLLLICQGERKVLIDTGIGDYHNQKFRQQFAIETETNPLEKALAQLSLRPDEITDLVLSHLHFDHIGGIAQLDQASGQMSAVFKNATCHIHKKHYQYSQNPTARDAGSFQSQYFEPIVKYYQDRSQMNWLDQEQQGWLIEEIGLQYRVSFGHTPWMIHPFDESVIYLADLIPTSHHLHIPWVMGYDIAAGQTTQYKEDFLNFIVQNNLTVIYEHDSQYWGGQLKSVGQQKYQHTQLYQKQSSQAYQLIF